MVSNLTQQNQSYWQKYKPGEIPTTPKDPPEELLNNINGPILDVGTGDGVLAEKLVIRGFDVFGIDIAKNIIEENQKRQSKVIYSVQDITTKTNFPDNYFDLIIFKFTLTNVHRDSWKRLGDEVTRILKPSGKVWLVEPLVSESYRHRYDLASSFLADKHCVYVFNDKQLAEKINSPEDLQKAIDQNQVSRIVKHYTLEEISDIFNKLKLIDHRTIEVVSPSGFIINTFEGVFRRLC